MGWVSYQLYRDRDWSIEQSADGKYITNEGANRAIQLDIRQSLKELLGILRCHNMQAIPRYLKRIARQTDRSLKAKAEAKRRSRARLKRKKARR